MPPRRPSDGKGRRPVATTLDAWLPAWDVRERHRTRVRASPDATYAALRTTDLAGSPVVGALLLLRALPGALLRGPAGLSELRGRGREPVTLATFERHGLRVLDERPPDELVIGLEGRFWLPTGDLCTPAASAFCATEPAPGTARAVWNFTVAARADGTTELATETRVYCADAGARRRFLPYWYVIRPFSGIIRRAMLNAIRRAAEAAAT